MYIYIKRIFDIVISFLSLIILAPFFILIILAIKIDSRGPVLFKQRRVGKNKVHFYILKFRTMYVAAPKDCPTHLLENPDMYITRVGKFLRKTSLDELPQIINILIGQMSIIGPRPALWNQYDLIEERDKNGANSIRPGLTGLAQISGRDALTIENKAKLDGKYKKELCFVTDVKCFFATLRYVFNGEGIVEGNAKIEHIVMQQEEIKVK